MINIISDRTVCYALLLITSNEYGTNWTPFSTITIIYQLIVKKDVLTSQQSFSSSEVTN